MPSLLIHSAALVSLIHGLLLFDTSSDASKTVGRSGVDMEAEIFSATSFFTPIGNARIGRAEFPLELVYVGEPPEEMSLAEVAYAIQRSAKTWSTVGCAEVELTYGGHVDTIEELGPDAIPIVHLARDQSTCLQLGNNTRVGAAPCIISEVRSAGVVLNRDSVRWYNMEDTVPEIRRVAEGERPWVDLEATLTHELGHILGLAHPAPVMQPRAAMLGTYRVDGGQRRLSASDRANLCALYPSPSTPFQECTSDGQCMTRSKDAGAACVERGSWQVCDKEAGQTGDYCADNLLICKEFCIFTSMESASGYCSMRCDEDAQCPQAWQCNQGETRLTSALPALEPDQGVCVPEFGQAEPVDGGCSVVTRAEATQRKEERPTFTWLLLLLGGFLVRGVLRRSRWRRACSEANRPRQSSRA